MELTYGAINIETNLYETPTDASKLNSYVCPCCNLPVILRKGLIRRHHFAHRSDSKCELYSGGESDVHKAAKSILAYQLRKLDDFNIDTRCTNCNKYVKYNIKLPSRYDVINEYIFTYHERTRIADVAIVGPSGDIHSIYEVYHTHCTDESARPEPWFELNASDILEHKYICLRDHNVSCNTCILRKHFNAFKHYYSYKHSRIQLYKRIISLRDIHLKYLLQKVSSRIKNHKYKIYKLECVIQFLEHRINNQKNVAFIKLKQNASLNTQDERDWFCNQRYIENIKKGRDLLNTTKENTRREAVIQFQKNRWKRFGFNV